VGHPSSVTFDGCSYRYARQMSVRPSMAGVLPRRLHDLRHLAASDLLRAGVPLEQVSKLLRHASISMTADTYGHVRADDEALAMLGECWRSSVPRGLLPARIFAAHPAPPVSGYA
jgi:integrase